jgi:L-seryl-tRNA(Sec) selenium transferase (EC 2.9.1.1)
LSRYVTRAALETIENYSNLEFDIETGKRGSRHDYLRDILCRLTGAEDAVVVNNNAAAVLLILSTFAKNKEVIVSRGELVEIGGSFRVPSVMEQSGSKLVEVGTTNKTHAYDYENAITDDTALLMKIHTSNFKIMGFTQSLEIKQIKEIGEKYNIPVVEDIGSGVLIDLRKLNMPYEPTVQDSINQGADIVSF